MVPIPARVPAPLKQGTHVSLCTQSLLQGLISETDRKSNLSYYIDAKIGEYIQDRGGVFSISSLTRISMPLYCFCHSNIKFISYSPAWNILYIYPCVPTPSPSGLEELNNSKPVPKLQSQVYGKIPKNIQIYKDSSYFYFLTLLHYVTVPDQVWRYFTDVNLTSPKGKYRKCMEHLRRSCMLI